MNRLAASSWARMAAASLRGVSAWHSGALNCRRMLVRSRKSRTSARLAGQHVFGQKVGHGPVAAGELGDEVGHAALAGQHRVQRHRRQPQRRHPAFGLAVQRVDLGRPIGVGARRARPAQRQELPRLVAREAQQLGVDLQQLAGHAQPAQAQLGQAARAQHQLAAARQLVDDLAHQAQHGGLGDQFEVIQEQRKRRAVAGQRIHHRQRCVRAWP